MLRINKITSDPSQKQTVVLSDGTFISLAISFKPMQLGWFIDELIYGNFVLHGVRIVVSPNFLFQYRNSLPFGLACYSVANREPSLRDDFSSGNAKLYVVSGEEVEAYAEYLKLG